MISDVDEATVDLMLFTAVVASSAVDAYVNTSYSTMVLGGEPLMEVTVAVDPSGKLNNSSFFISASSKCPIAPWVCSGLNDDASKLLTVNDPEVVTPTTSTSSFKFGTESEPGRVIDLVDDAMTTSDATSCSVVGLASEVVMVATAVLASSEESTRIVISYETSPFSMPVTVTVVSSGKSRDFVIAVAK